VQAIFYNYKQKPVQRMLDFDYLCGEHPACMALNPGARAPSSPLVHTAGRATPSVGCVVVPGSSGGFQKLFFGKEEIAIPSYGRCARNRRLTAACQHQDVSRRPGACVPP
jgi:ATP citrate (pro-S)-lyase